MALWVTSETITAAKLNQKEVYVGSAAPGTTYAGMLWLDTDDNLFYQRNAANNAWLERPALSLAHTITGLWTFNRGAAAPFAVDAASTKITNLDADKIDGYDAGLSDGDVAALPVATEGQILVRGSGDWEAQDMRKKIEIIEFRTFQRNDSLLANWMRRAYASPHQDYDTGSIVKKISSFVGYDEGFFMVPMAGTITRVTAGIDIAIGGGRTLTFTYYKNGGSISTLAVIDPATSNSKAESESVSAGDMLTVAHTVSTVGSNGSSVFYFVIEYD